MKKARIVLKLDDSGFYILSRQFLDFFVFWKVCVEFAFPRVAMGLLDFVNHIEEDQHICRQGSKADNEVNGRIVGGIHCIFAHVLEGREGLCEHAPEGQSMGSVLQPCAFAYCECSRWSAPGAGQNRSTMRGAAGSCMYRRSSKGHKRQSRTTAYPARACLCCRLWLSFF